MRRRMAGSRALGLEVKGVPDAFSGPISGVLEYWNEPLLGLN